jgi:hypothetical protein
MKITNLLHKKMLSIVAKICSKLTKCNKGGLQALITQREDTRTSSRQEIVTKSKKTTTKGKK